MKRFFFWILLLATASYSGYGQKKYTKSGDFTFTNGIDGFSFGGACSDICGTLNKAEGWAVIEVDHKHIPRYKLNKYMANCWTTSIVFDQNNRYMEFRVKSDTAQLLPMTVNITGSCDGCCPEEKIWTGNTFTIPKADTWTIVLLKIPQTTGGSQNIIDTVGSLITWDVENGKYTFDYVKIGEAAIPPKPIINPVKDKIVYYKGASDFSLRGISIPDRFLEGLKINIEAKSGTDVIREISLVGNPFKLIDTATAANAILRIVPDSAAAGMSDSVFITLTDTIRNTSTKVAFKVDVTNQPLYLNKLIAEKIKMYPSPTSGLLTIDFPEIFTGNISVVDMLGGVVANQKIESVTSKIDLSAVAPGIYIIRISVGEDVIYRKIQKI